MTALKKEQLLNGQWVFTGRATCVSLSDGTQVVLMCRTDSELQKVCDMLGEADMILDSQYIKDAVLGSRNAFEYDNEL